MHRKLFGNNANSMTQFVTRKKRIQNASKDLLAFFFKRSSLSFAFNHNSEYKQTRWDDDFKGRQIRVAAKDLYKQDKVLHATIALQGHTVSGFVVALSEQQRVFSKAGHCSRLEVSHNARREIKGATKLAAVKTGA